MTEYIFIHNIRVFFESCDSDLHILFGLNESYYRENSNDLRITTLRTKIGKSKYTANGDIEKNKDELNFFHLFTDDCDNLVEWMVSNRITLPLSRRSDLEGSFKRGQEMYRSIYYVDGRVFNIKTNKFEVGDVMAVSHRWISKEHPDPDNLQFKEILACNFDFLFYDYCCLFQRPRTESEEWIFKRELANVDEIYKKCKVYICEEGSEDYSQRAWCFLEWILSVGNQIGNIQLLPDFQEFKRVARSIYIVNNIRFTMDRPLKINDHDLKIISEKYGVMVDFKCDIKPNLEFHDNFLKILRLLKEQIKPWRDRRFNNAIRLYLELCEDGFVPDLDEIIYWFDICRLNHDEISCLHKKVFETVIKVKKFIKAVEAGKSKDEKKFWEFVHGLKVTNGSDLSFIVSKIKKNLEI